MLFVSFTQFDLHEAVQELDIIVSAVLYAVFILNRIKPFKNIFIHLKMIH
jgi:hypothetical protein